jgi:hypothetical protein
LYQNSGGVSLFKLSKWEERRGNQTWYGYLVLGLLWVAVSAGLNAMERTGAVFGLTAVSLSKVMFVVIVAAGRLYLFPRYRLKSGVCMFFSLFALILCGAGIPRIRDAFSGYYLLLIIADTAIWSFYLTLFFEVLCALGVYWSGVEPGAYRELNQFGLWRCFWTELLYLGIWLTLLLGLAFYYLVNFFLADVFFYSQIFAGILAGLGVIFFGVAYSRINGWLREEIGLLDQKIGIYSDWRNMDSQVLNVELPVYQYLLLTRDYLGRLKNPSVFPGTIVFYLLCILFLLSLPLWVGIVAKV